MNMLFVRFNADGTVASTTTRVNGKKVELEIWEGYEFYQVLLALGVHPIETNWSDGGKMHMILY